MSIRGYVTHYSSREYYLVNTSTLVTYQGKPVSFHPARSPHGMTSDHVLNVYNSTSDNNNRLNPYAGNVLPRIN